MAKIKVGVLGAARGRSMIDVLFSHPEAELVAVCDWFRPLLDSVGEAAEEKGLKVALYDDFEDFIKCDMDAVVLANFANEHAPFAIRLLKAGFHVMSEVLPCASMAQAVELIEAVEESGKVYAYAENYSYSTKTFEMWQRYERGDIGEIMYAEGEYIHDCTGCWDELTRGERDHWRNLSYSTFYCTHSIAPILTITGRRPVQVVGFETFAPDYAVAVGQAKGCGGIEMITLDNGAIARSLHAEFRREPGNTSYVLNGTRGTMETNRMNDTTMSIYRVEEEKPMQEYTPTQAVAPELAQKFSGHGGADFYPTHFFLEKILGRPDGNKYSIDVYQAVDMGICGILAYRSILNGNIPIAVPDLRDPAQRDAYRNDHACTNPAEAGDQLWPINSKKDFHIPDEVYDNQKKSWKEKNLKRAEEAAKKAAEDAEKAAKAAEKAALAAERMKELMAD
ncbi:MAG: Gfo/Idh/MocA family oxidoreductase [Ruminococcaceae bacterium]|nr:Gfo/Idh/MocA family oxidoreductase [Oscillospiraceae bacterium]